MAASLALAQRATEPRTPAAAPPATEQPRTTAPEARRAAQPDTARQPDAAIQPADARRAAQVEAAGQRTTAPATVGQATVSRPFGIQFEGQDDLVVAEIAPGSTAAQAGLRARDRIISVDGRPITGQRRFLGFLSGLGRRVPLVIEREGQQYTVQFAPGRGDSQGGWLGVYLEDSEDGQQGAKITHVYPAGPAARAGLRAGDVVLQVNNNAIAGTPDLIATIDQFQPQSKVNLRFARGERQLDATAVLANRNSFVMYQGGYGDEQGRGEFDGGQQFEDDAYSNVPPHAMQLEHDRRMAEQHERIETELRKLQEEVRLLREAIQKR
jgi:membrane-associated protease RseP (regulator of RpoE activity)